MAKTKKIDMLRNHLLRGHTVTPREAIEKWNYYRLAVGVFQLRAKGFPIETVIKRNPTNTIYAEYHMDMGVLAARLCNGHSGLLEEVKQADVGVLEELGITTEEDG
jgi:hypothetical protein